VADQRALVAGVAKAADGLLQSAYAHRNVEPVDNEAATAGRLVLHAVAAIGDLTLPRGNRAESGRVSGSQLLWMTSRSIE